MDKQERVNLMLNQKLLVTQKLEWGVSVSHICEQYDIKKANCIGHLKKQTK